MTKQSGPRFDLAQITPIEWVIQDNRFDENDARHTVAFVWEVDPGECEVVWLNEAPFPRWYASVHEVLADVRSTAPRSTPPVPIPHRPPINGLTRAG